MSAGKKSKPPWQSRLEARALRAVINWPKVLPFQPRVAVVAWLMAWVAAPIAGYRKRVRENLAYVCPELPHAEVQRLMRQVPANAGRMLAESSAGQEFVKRMEGEPLTGSGVEALETAKAAGRPIILVTGHFGNFDAMRAALVLKGYNIGAVYRPINDPGLDAAFVELLTGIAEPVFPRGRAGMVRMIRHLRGGGTVAILIDQYVNRGAPLTFFGKTAPTALSAAEMALKYKALLVPVYGIRRPDRGFDLVVETPVEPSDPETMTQALNDSLEAQIRAHMDQWLWIHRRWKPERQAKQADRQRARAAAKTAP